MFCPVCRSDYADDWKVCPKDAATLLRSASVGKYRIDRLLGVGGMGAVFEAHNPDTQSQVALKLMHGQAAANDAARQRFQREAAAVAALRTRHVVSIYDFGADADGTMYLVMEYLQGHTLRAEIRPAPDAMVLPRVNFVVEQALRGLGAAHRAGIVHRDLKPENLFLADTDDGEVVKILDFGIARVSRGDTPNLTHSGALMGTPAYMAPEQVAGNRGQIGPHSDVYAIGVITYELLTGISPFAADTLSEVLSKILSRTFVPLAEARPDLPAALARVVDRCLADDPAARFASADALREAWAAAWAELPAEVRTATVPTFGKRAAAAGGALAATAAAAPVTATAPTAHAAPVATSPSVRTPPPVVVDSRSEPPRSRRPVVAIGGGVVAIGVATAVALGVGRDDRDAPAAAPDAAPRLAAIDAAPPTPPDAPAVPADMVRFAGGSFTMGVAPGAYKKNPSLDPAHEVTVAPFLLDKLEATRDGERLPLASIAWADADAHCRARGRRLPTAAEWDFAARAAPLDATGAALLARGRRGAVEVGTHPGDCTPEGVCDLLGNVMEWTADDWPGKPDHKVVRGASWAVAPDAGWYATIHARVPVPPTTTDPEIGFRCAADAD